MSEIKENLLKILRETHPEGLRHRTHTDATPNLTPLPKSAEDIILGAPDNKNDLSEGWTEIESEDDDSKECPKSLGLKNADALAFVISQGGKAKIEFWVEFSDLNALYPDEDEDVEMQ